MIPFLPTRTASEGNSAGEFGEPAGNQFQDIGRDGFFDLRVFSNFAAGSVLEKMVKAFAGSANSFDILSMASDLL